MDNIVSINTKPKKTDIASTILWGYHRSNMTGWNDDNAVLHTNFENKGGDVND